MIVILSFVVSLLSASGVTSPNHNATLESLWWSDKVALGTYRPEYGPPARYVSEAVRQWARHEQSEALLIHLGRTPRGAWYVAATWTDPVGSRPINLVLIDTSGKEHKYDLEGPGNEEDVSADGADSYAFEVMARLWRLSENGVWDEKNLQGTRSLAISEAPNIAYRETPKKRKWNLLVAGKSIFSESLGHDEGDSGSFSPGIVFSGAKWYLPVTVEDDFQVWPVLIQSTYMCWNEFKWVFHVRVE